MDLHLHNIFLLGMSPQLHISVQHISGKSMCGTGCPVVHISQPVMRLIFFYSSEDKISFTLQ